MAGVPHHVVVAVLDQVATENELKFQALEGVGVGEAKIDFPARKSVR